MRWDLSPLYESITLARDLVAKFVEAWPTTLGPRGAAKHGHTHQWAFERLANTDIRRGRGSRHTNRGSSVAWDSVEALDVLGNEAQARISECDECSYSPEHVRSASSRKKRNASDLRFIGPSSSPHAITVCEHYARVTSQNLLYTVSRMRCPNK